MRNRQSSVGEQIFYCINYCFLVLCVGITLFPLVNIVATSLSSSNAIISGEVFLWPKQPTLEAYRNVVEDGQVFVAMKNTVIITVVGVVFNMAATILCAYPLSRKRLMGRGIFSGIIVFTMLFGGGMIPSFLLVKMLGIMDSYWALWLPQLISVYNMIIMKTFFQSIPDSLEEAAALDGANDFYILIKVFLPLSGSILATLTLFYAVSWWNEYYNSMIYINSSSKLPMTVKLMQMVQNMNQDMLRGSEGVIQKEQSLVAQSVRSASIVVTILPILCVYPFLQKYFVKGVMIGSVKG